MQLSHLFLPPMHRILVKVLRVWRNSFPSASRRGNSLRRNLPWGKVCLKSSLFMSGLCVEHRYNQMRFFFIIKRNTFLLRSTWERNNIHICLLRKKLQPIILGLHKKHIWVGIWPKMLCAIKTYVIPYHSISVIIMINVRSLSLFKFKVFPPEWKLKKPVG